MRLYAVARFQLRQQKRCELVGWKIARADVDPAVLIELAAKETAPVRTLFAHDLRTFDVPGVVDDQGTSFATGEVLRFVKTQRGEGPERPERSAPVGSQEPVRVVFDNGDSV